MSTITRFIESEITPPAEMKENAVYDKFVEQQQFKSTVRCFFLFTYIGTGDWWPAAHETSSTGSPSRREKRDNCPPLPLGK